MAKSVISNPDISPLLQHDSARAEASIVANELVDGMSIACKIRCDLITMNGKYILDLKTTVDSSKEKFTKTFMSLGYWMQAAHYVATARLAGINVERFIFIAVETKPPYSVALYELTKKTTVRAQMQTHGFFLPDADENNVVAELKGSEFPDQIITIGGHLDSWDVNEGAHDDGAGIVQTMEVLRTMKALNYQPKHTI
ncbi:MAG: M28 family peptidase, partial [Nitrosopumilaceae archaeon]|nr:M28 family peptidase [Nitrosopumilaceae archaeon]